jgi:hypothetical protein
MSSGFLVGRSATGRDNTAQVIKEALGGDEKVTEIEAALQAQIDEQRAPSKAAGVPWA